MSLPPAVLAAAWPEIRVIGIHVCPAHHDRAHNRRVHACVHLGRLLPVDVRVEVLPGDAAADDARGHRMFSIHSYHNGSYLFEATLPADELMGEDGLVVRVSPRAQLRTTAAPAPVIARAPAYAPDERDASRRDDAPAGALVTSETISTRDRRETGSPAMVAGPVTRGASMLNVSGAPYAVSTQAERAEVM
ncbi:MAG TPA: hypothetical protein VFK13_07555 [Gemmatimonadaceae bacterium]|nr:hypothetical protein [Gemmatimonadaceae bacterium]